MSVRFSDYEEVHRELHNGDDGSDHMDMDHDSISSFLLSDVPQSRLPESKSFTHAALADLDGSFQRHASQSQFRMEEPRRGASLNATSIPEHNHSPGKTGRQCPGCLAVLRYQGQSALDESKHQAYELVTQTAHDTQVGMLKAQIKHSQDLMQAYASALDELKAEFYAAVGTKDRAAERQQEILLALRAGLLSFNPRSYVWSISVPALPERGVRLDPESDSIGQAPVRRVIDPHHLHLYPEYPGSAEIVDVHRTAPPEVIINDLAELSPGNVKRTLDVLAGHAHLLGTRVVRLISYVEKSSITNRLRMERYAQTLAFRTWRSNAQHLRKVKQLGVHKWQNLQQYHNLTRNIADMYRAKRRREQRNATFKNWLGVLRSRWERSERGYRLEQWRQAKRRELFFKAWRFQYCLCKNTRDNLAVAYKRQLMRWWDRWRGNFFNKRAHTLDKKETTMNELMTQMREKAERLEATRLLMKERHLANATRLVEQNERICMAKHFMSWRTWCRMHSLEQQNVLSKVRATVRQHNQRWTMLVKVAFHNWCQISEFNQTLDLLSNVRLRADNRKMLLHYYTNWKQKLEMARINKLYRKKVIDRLQLHFNNRMRMDCFHRWQIVTRAHKCVKRAIETKRRKMLTLAIHTWASVTSEEMKGLLGSELADRENELRNTYNQVDALADAKKQLEHEMEEKEREMKKALRQVELYKAQAMGNIDVQGTLHNSIIEEDEREALGSRQEHMRPGSRLSASHFSPSERPGGRAPRSTSRLSHRSIA